MFNFCKKTDINSLSPRNRTSAESINANRSNPWKINEGILGPSGELQNEYFFAGRKAIRHVLNSRKAKHLGGYYLIERDLRNIRTWIAQILTLQRTLPAYAKGRVKQKRQGDPHTNDVIKGLFVAVLIFYGKLFPPAKGRLVCLDASTIKDPEERSIHENLIGFRHNFAAHSGEDLAERTEIVAVLVRPPNEHIRPLLACELSQPSSWGMDYLIKVDAFIEGLRVFASSKKEELYGAVRTEDISEKEVKSIIDLYTKAGVL